jgi:carotenoid 1,2-hydratase
LDPPPVARLPDTRWRIRRETRADRGANVLIRQTLEDGPFYARSLLSTRIFGETAEAVHESLSLDRFATGWVRMLLPFRMPRAWS